MLKESDLDIKLIDTRENLGLYMDRKDSKNLLPFSELDSGMKSKLKKPKPLSHPNEKSDGALNLNSG